MHYLITGVAGFIGMHTAEQLLKDEHRVTGIDCYLDSYPREVKEDRINNLLQYDRF